MNKPSDRLDFLEKILDLRNQEIENHKRNIVDEINWLEENAENSQALQTYFAKLYRPEIVLQLNNKQLQELLQIRANDLYSYLQRLGNQKTNNLPLKVIVQELKYFGK